MKNYRKKGLQPMMPWASGMNMEGVSISKPDLANGSPQAGDMIATSTKNPDDVWLVAFKFFKENYEPE
jgi:hypothetical protein